MYYYFLAMMVIYNYLIICRQVDNSTVFLSQNVNFESYSVFNFEPRERGYKAS